MKICVFDQSSKRTGYAIFQDSTLVHWGLLDYSNNDDSSARIELMSKSIASIIEQTKPDKVVFEDVNQRNNVKILITLSRLQGMIMFSCYENQTKFTIYSPTTWRKIIGIKQGSKIKRECLKEQAINFVHKNYDLRVNDDIAESICIGAAYLKERNMISDFKA